MGPLTAAKTYFRLIVFSSRDLFQLYLFCSFEEVEYALQLKEFIQ